MYQHIVLKGAAFTDLQLTPTSFCSLYCEDFWKRIF